MPGRRSLRNLPLILLLGHTGLITALAVLIWTQLRDGHREAVHLWTLAVLVDFPVVPVLGRLEAVLLPLLNPKGALVRWVIFPAIAHIVLGGLMWFVLGWLASWLVGRRANPGASVDPPAM